MTEAAGVQYWVDKNQPGNFQVTTLTKWFGLANLQAKLIGLGAIFLAGADLPSWRKLKRSCGRSR